MSRILLVEDEETLLETLSLNLELEGYELTSLSDGAEVMALVEGEHFDLIILDVMLPHISGFELCTQIRLREIDTPILFLTAKDTAADRIQGLRLGADDYLPKPFELEELLLRVQILLKRREKQGHHNISLESYNFAGHSIDFLNYKAKTAEGKDIQLTKKEAMLLKLLIERRGQVLSRQQILQSVWGYDVYPSTRTIDNFILSFRKYFEPEPKTPRFFHSIRGVGYRFDDSNETN